MKKFGIGAFILSGVLRFLEFCSTLVIYISIYFGIFIPAIYLLLGLVLKWTMHLDFFGKNSTSLLFQFGLLLSLLCAVIISFKNLILKPIISYKSYSALKKDAKRIKEDALKAKMYNDNPEMYLAKYHNVSPPIEINKGKYIYPTIPFMDKISEKNKYKQKHKSINHNGQSQSLFQQSKNNSMLYNNGTAINQGNEIWTNNNKNPNEQYNQFNCNIESSFHNPDNFNNKGNNSKSNNNINKQNDYNNTILNNTNEYSNKNYPVRYFSNSNKKLFIHEYLDYYDIFKLEKGKLQFIEQKPKIDF